jgi:cytochrome c oxidase subunit 4
MAGHAYDIQKHIRTYMMVFASLAALTVITVGISYMHLSTPAAITLALIVATVKGSLVALFFMHLVSEEKIIYWILGLTVSFFVVIMYLPTGWHVDLVRVNQVWDKLPAEGGASHSAEHGAAAASHGEAAPAGEHH